MHHTFGHHHSHYHTYGQPHYHGPYHHHRGNFYGHPPYHHHGGNFFRHTMHAMTGLAAFMFQPRVVFTPPPSPPLFTVLPRQPQVTVFHSSCGVTAVADSSPLNTTLLIGGIALTALGMVGIASCNPALAGTGVMLLTLGLFSMMLGSGLGDD